MPRPRCDVHGVRAQVGSPTLLEKGKKQRPHSGEGGVEAKAVSFLMVTFNCNIGIVIIITWNKGCHFSKHSFNISNVHMCITTIVLLEGQHFTKLCK